MFQVPEGWKGSGGGDEWEELDNFDTEDLWSEKAFVIVQQGEDPEAGRKAFVWIGEQFKVMEDSAFVRLAAKTLLEAHGWGAHGEAAEVREGDEEDGFWDLFELG
ncbi:hypothetical protein T484DRAFT_1985300 [Baffinella frigidus]|nr:hypothetical protein T484DRAFT_1985300 [Cryptophyta sp. CCMP2293]